MNGTLGFAEAVEQEIAAGIYVPWGCPADPNGSPDAEPQQYYDWRWNVVRNVLFHPEDGVVSTWEDRVVFGLTLYTAYIPGQDDPTCPLLDQVDFSIANRDAMLAAMKCSDTGNDTPTRESLIQVAQALSQKESDGPKVIILATDGTPDSCECPDYEESAPEACRPSTMVERGGAMMSPELAERFDLVQESKRISQELGIQISVIDVSTPDNVELHQHLAEVAEAGGGSLYSGLEPATLRSAFDGLALEARSCEIDLGGEITSGNEAAGTITLDGQELSLLGAEDGDGYRVVSPSQLELSGDACQAIKVGNHDLRISFPCNAFEVVR
jgi:hypothetical protein